MLRGDTKLPGRYIDGKLPAIAHQGDNRRPTFSLNKSNKSGGIPVQLCASILQNGVTYLGARRFQ